MTARMYQICVTLYDWEHICERFEGATHYAEKALYKLLSKHIVPEITAELRVSLFFGDLGTGYEQGKQEIQRKRQMEEAVSQRKRSSRLAIKESEKEEVRLTSLRKAEEEEKLSRLRRLEARQKREEEERLRREAAREKRRLDREERERRAQTEEEEKWVRFFPNLTHSLTFASTPGRMQAPWSMLLETTHHNASLPPRFLKPSPDDQERRLLHQRRVPLPVQVARGHQSVKIGCWIARSVISLV